MTVPPTPPGDGGPRSVEEARQRVIAAANDFADEFAEHGLARHDAIKAALTDYAAAVRADERDAVLANTPDINHPGAWTDFAAWLRARAQSPSDASRGRPLG